MPRRLLRALATVAFLCCLIPSEPRAAFFNTPSDQRFHLGQASTPANNVFISCSGNNIVMNVPVKIQLPFTGLQWDTTVGAPTKGGPNAGLIDPIPVPTVSQITMNPNTSFVAPQNFTVGNLSLRNFTLVRPPQSLQMSINNGSTFPFTDTNGFSVRVADIPSVASSAAQTLSPGLTVPMTAFTVTESADGTNGGIWAATDLRLTIPLIAGLAHVTWSGTPTCSGNAVTNGRVAASPGFTLTEDGGRTARIFVGADFQASESVTISGLNYVVSGTCPDTSFQVGVRTGDSTNATVHRFDANSKTVQGLPTISSAAPNQVFTRGDPSTPANTITIKDSPGTSKFTVGPAGGDIRIKIPASFNCTWDTSIGSVVIGPPAVGPSGAARVSTTLLPYENGGRTAVLNVTSNFPNATSEGFTVSGLAFANFTGTSLAVPLELESTNDTTSEAFDNRTIAIGTPTIASSGAQIFQTSPPGPATVGMATLTIREDLFIPRIGTSAGRVSSIRITIPAAFPMTWEGLSPAVTTGKLSTVVSYAGGNKTLVLSATADFATNETATVSGLNFVLTAAAATPDNLQLFMSGAGTATVTDLDSQIIAIGGVATISSAANQAFTTNSPPVLAQPILITDANGVASITAANDIRITIPAGFNMVWDGSVGSVGIGLPPSGPSGAGKVSTILLPYEDAGRTAVLNVGINFSINEGFVVTGLRFANFTNSSPSNNLLLRVTAVGPPANADDKSIAIGKPVISIPASQVYGTNDPSTLFPTITIGDDAVTPRITAGPVGGDVRIRIPAGLSMVWDTSVTTPTITWLGAGGSKVSGTLLPYEDLNKTVVVDITAPFAAGDSFTIAGLRVLPGAAETGPLALELETDNASSLANATTAPRTVTVNNRPTIVSSTTLDSDGNGSIDRLIITFSEQINPAGVSATTGAGLALAGYIIANGTPGTPNINSITYRLAESGLPDTGVTPALTYDPLASGADLADMQGLATSSLASPLRLDAAAPVVVGFSAADTDGNGRLNSIVVTFSENLVAGQEDINDWILIDANGTTNLLAGLTSGSLSIVNNTLTITLTNTDGSAGVPRFQYKSDGLNGTLRDAAGNLVPFQTNNTAPVANAGPNQTLAPTKVTLNGSASSDPDGQPVSFQWLQTLGPPVILND
ncbi:MAG: hypothetical protein HY293_13420, partial [Planctomycetes bacterium]|nr:hypothetical protein [Planctomycetota bacterium]